MPRRKIIPDTEVLAEARQLCAMGGERALSFGTLARATGLAASTLSQRFGSVPGLQAAAARDGWQRLILALEEADHQSQDKGAAALLKLMQEDCQHLALLLAITARDEAAVLLAQDWRNRMETALALRLGQSEKSRQNAQMLFAAWQGRVIWGAEGYRLKDLVKRLG